LNDRFWTWVELKRPSPSADRDDFSLWSFNTTEGDRMVQVTCYVSMPKGSAPADTETEVRSASPVFVEMLKRLRIEAAK